MATQADLDAYYADRPTRINRYTDHPVLRAGMNARATTVGELRTAAEAAGITLTDAEAEQRHREVATLLAAEDDFNYWYWESKYLAEPQRSGPYFADGDTPTREFAVALGRIMPVYSADDLRRELELWKFGTRDQDTLEDWTLEIIMVPNPLISGMVRQDDLAPVPAPGDSASN